MKKSLYFGIIILIAAFTLNSCKDDKPTPISLGTLMVDDIDLNAATAPTNVPVDPVITATFNTTVDAATATSSNITLTEDYDNVSIPLTIVTSGNEVTITPDDNLANGAVYKLAITNGLKSTDGEVLSAVNRSFTTLGSFLPAGMTAYWNFDGNANDQTGLYSSPAVTDVTYVTGRNAASGQAASFNGTTSLIQYPMAEALVNTSDFSLSFWMKTDTTAKRSQFVMGLAGWYGFQFEINTNKYGTQNGQVKLAAQYSVSDGTSASQDLWFDGSGSTKDNGGWQGWTFCKDLNSGTGTGVNGLIAQKWAHIVATYNHTTKIGTIYINGEKMKEQDFNLYPVPLLNATGLKYAGLPTNNTFVLGFIQDKSNPTIPDAWAAYSDPANNHFKGLLDDVAIYHTVLTPALITSMYNSGKP
jgi:hypothetical protein